MNSWKCYNWQRAESKRKQADRAYSGDVRDVEMWGHIGMGNSPGADKQIACMSFGLSAGLPQSKAREPEERKAKQKQKLWQVVGQAVCVAAFD